MQRLQHRLRVGFCDAEEGAGGAFGASVSLFPVLEGAGANAHEGGKLILAESEADRRPLLECGNPGALLSGLRGGGSANDGLSFALGCLRSGQRACFASGERDGLMIDD